MGFFKGKLLQTCHDSCVKCAFVCVFVCVCGERERESFGGAISVGSCDCPHPRIALWERALDENRRLEGRDVGKTSRALGRTPLHAPPSKGFSERLSHTKRIHQYGCVYTEDSPVMSVRHPMHVLCCQEPHSGISGKGRVTLPS